MTWVWQAASEVFVSHPRHIQSAACEQAQAEGRHSSGGQRVTAIKSHITAAIPQENQCPQRERNSTPRAELALHCKVREEELAEDVKKRRNRSGADSGPSNRYKGGGRVISCAQG